MEALLLIITVVSIAITIVSLATAYRQHQRERQRSDARIAALAQAAETHSSHDGGWKQVAGEWQWVSEPAGNRDSGVRDTAPSDLVSSEGLFGTVQREQPSSSRLPLMAAAVLIIILGGAVMFLNTPSADEEVGTVVQTSRSEPLELVALAHIRETSLLTISGTVRNPMTGSKVEGLTAVVSLLDRNGALVSTKDVPLDYRALGPGEEAPFKVAVPDAGLISRYRVSFRAGTDVVPHVDRRTDTKLASAVR
jgi:hypothetical protein